MARRFHGGVGFRSLCDGKRFDPFDHRADLFIVGVGESVAAADILEQDLRLHTRALQGLEIERLSGDEDIPRRGDRQAQMVRMPHDAGDPEFILQHVLSGVVGHGYVVDKVSDAEMQFLRKAFFDRALV